MNINDFSEEPSRFDDQIEDIFHNKFLDNDYQNINIKYFIKNELLSHQMMHVSNLLSCLKHNGIAFDGSATGTGKTYTSLAVCKQLNLNPIIVCTKSTRSIWKQICKKFSVTPASIVNYELLRVCKDYDEHNNIIKSKYLSIDDKKKYCWNLNFHKTLLIFDEVHKCKNHLSQLGKLLMSSKHKCKILMLSATICDKETDFLVFGYMLGFYNRLGIGKTWVKNIIREDKQIITKKKYSALSTYLFPNFGSKMMISDMDNSIRENNISVECYDIDKEKIKIINNNLNLIKNNIVLKDISETRQCIEKVKLDIIFEQMIKYYELDKSIVVFVNYVKSLETLSEKLTKLDINHSILIGGQSQETREKNIDLFQFNKNRIILSMIQVGGTSIGLHDTSGKYPRVSIISPSFSSIEIVQALGRIYRSNVKSNCLQKLIFCANTYEEKICDIIKNKSSFISKLTDDDLII